MIGRGILVALLCGVSAYAAPVDWQVYPTNISLHTSRDFQTVVVQAVADDGVTTDITDAVKIDVTKPELVTVSGNRFAPKTDGVAEVVFSYEGQSRRIPLSVTNAVAERPISFNLDVMPVFTRAGCNSGVCHGSSRGKDAFMLSLFGYDPAGDYFRLTREFSGRRINTAFPEKSLLIEKAIGAVQHTGGELFTKESPLYEPLVRWLEAGANYDKEDVAQLVKLEMYPAAGVIEGEASSQQLTVRAMYSDGTDRDVTALANFYSSDEGTLSVKEGGRIVAGQRGEAFVIARLATLTTGAPFIVIPKNAEEVGELPEHNYIDRHVNNKLRKLRMEPSPLASDEVFLRRVFIDIIGQLPSEDEYRRFIADTSPDKRAITKASPR